jgi:hypothetical protein
MLLGLGLATQHAVADDRFFPPDSAPFGKTFREWSAEWWQFVMSLPVATNPILDETGDLCMVGQHGPVWFLFGVFGSGRIERRCTIPEGTALFFPIVNVVSANTPNVCGQGPDNKSVQELRGESRRPVNTATNLLVKIDGEPIARLRRHPEDFRVKSTVFSLVFPEAENLVDAFCGGDHLVGVYAPAVDDGFYVMLKPLTVGEHRVRFHGEMPDFGPTTQEVIYHLTVVPVARE